MKCLKCGTELREGAKFCKSCGSEVKQLQQVKQVADNSCEYTTSNEAVNEIMGRLLVFASDYSAKENELVEMKKANELLRQELQEKNDLLNRKNDVINELKNSVEKHCQKVEELQAELDILNSMDNLQEEYSEEIAVCPKCGSKVDENTIFCGECGTKVG